MTWFHVLQGAFACLAAVVVVRALRQAARDDDAATASGVYLLRGLGRIALPLAFVGVILDLGRALEGADRLGPGSVGGQAALERVFVGLAIGACTAVACLGAAASLRRRIVTRRRPAAGDPPGRALDRARGGV